MSQDKDMLPTALPALRARHLPFVSHAQNFEDVMLHRALGHVTDGQYVDIGAGEPDADSVTLAFYNANWRGVNVEPLLGPYTRLTKARPDDVNLNLAVGSSVGEAVLYVVGPESGLSTLDCGFAARYASEGWPIEERRVPVTTLADLWSTYVTGEIHFLKIDAEGAEHDVLRGADFIQWRPWIILIEATLPNSQIPSHETWEDVLTSAGYEFCYFDGLNRFYIAKEKAPSLRPAFAAPPNVTDNFVLARMMESPANRPNADQQYILHAAHERTDEAQARAHAAQCALDNEQARVAAAEARADHAQGIAHAALTRVSELQGELRTLEERLSMVKSECEALQRTASSRESEATMMRHETDQARLDRDTWAQELFESNRYAAELVKERQMLLDRCAASARHIAHMDEHERWRTEESATLHAQMAGWRQAEVALREEIVHIRDDLDHKAQEVVYFKGSFESILSSRSWRLSKPLRVIGRLVGR